MTRSRKKNCWEWLSKKWTKFHQRSLRQKDRKQLQQIKFDPDQDWLDSQVRKEWGTKCGWTIKPDPLLEPTWYGYYLKGLRK